MLAVTGARAKALRLKDGYFTQNAMTALLDHVENWRKMGCGITVFVVG